MDWQLQLRVVRLDVQPGEAVLPLHLHHAARLQLDARAAAQALVEVSQLDTIALKDPRGNLRSRVQHCNEILTM